jgi:hypothetical protein
MQDQVHLETVAELCEYVNRRLCEENDFLVGAFRLTHRVLYRGGSACGMMFCLHGPRSVQFTAIWETDKNSILLYGSSGQRLRRIGLLTSPHLEQLELLATS